MARQLPRCLGWQNLTMSHDTIVSAVVSALQSLNVPFDRDMLCHDGSIALILRPPETASSSSEESMHCSPLRITVHIFAADAENAGKQHVNVRRTQGSHWKFTAFYTAFRKEFSKELSLPDVTALSMFSPMQQKRGLENIGPAAGWTRGGCSSDTPSHKLQKRSAPASPSGLPFASSMSLLGRGWPSMQAAFGMSLVRTAATPAWPPSKSRRDD